MIANHLQPLQNACMTSITVRNIPESTRDQLASRARAQGRSLQEYLRTHLIALGSKPDKAEVLRRIEERVAATGTVVSVDEVLGDIDSGRR
jgi:plasmid stability protein